MRLDHHHLHLPVDASTTTRKQDVVFSAAAIVKKPRQSDEELSPWDFAYQELRAFYRQYGHCNVPVLNADNMTFSGLGLWVLEQRRDYALYKASGNDLDSKTHSMTSQKLVKLMMVNFAFQEGDDLARQYYYQPFESRLEEKATVEDHFEPDGSLLSAAMEVLGQCKGQQPNNNTTQQQYLDEKVDENESVSRAPTTGEDKTSSAVENEGDSERYLETESLPGSQEEEEATGNDSEEIDDDSISMALERKHDEIASIHKAEDESKKSLLESPTELVKHHTSTVRQIGSDSTTTSALQEKKSLKEKPDDDDSIPSIVEETTTAEDIFKVAPEQQGDDRKTDLNAATTDEEASVQGPMQDKKEESTPIDVETDFMATTLLQMMQHETTETEMQRIETSTDQSYMATALVHMRNGKTADVPNFSLKKRKRHVILLEDDDIQEEMKKRARQDAKEEEEEEPPVTSNGFFSHLTVDEGDKKSNCFTKREMLPYDFTPQPWSVVINGSDHSSVGNKRLQVLAAMHMVQYYALEDRERVLLELEETIRSASSQQPRNPTKCPIPKGKGAFVEYSRGRWWEVSSQTARRAIAKMLGQGIVSEEEEDDE